MDIDKFFNYKILFITMDRMCTALLMIFAWYVYGLLLKKDPKKIKYVPHTMLISTGIYLFAISIFRIQGTLGYSFAIPFIGVGLFLEYKAKNDYRGIRVLELINNQNNWNKVQIYFFPKDFSDKELVIIEKKLKEIFDEIINKFDYNKIGSLFLWIKKKKFKNSIRIVNVWDRIDEGNFNEVIEFYNGYSQVEDSEIEIINDHVKKVELNISIGKE